MKAGVPERPKAAAWRASRISSAFQDGRARRDSALQGVWRNASGLKRVIHLPVAQPPLGYQLFDIRAGLATVVGSAGGICGPQANQSVRFAGHSLFRGHFGTKVTTSDHERSRVRVDSKATPYNTAPYDPSPVRQREDDPLRQEGSGLAVCCRRHDRCRRTRGLAKLRPVSCQRDAMPRCHSLSVPQAYGAAGLRLPRQALSARDDGLQCHRRA